VLKDDAVLKENDDDLLEDGDVLKLGLNQWTDHVCKSSANVIYANGNAVYVIHTASCLHRM